MASKNFLVGMLAIMGNEAVAIDVIRLVRKKKEKGEGWCCY